jgi:hypothetical protein
LPDRIDIPPNVIDALRAIEEERPAEVEMYDRETVLLFAHVCGLDDACDWLCAHRELYFEALRRADERPASPLPRTVHSG